MGAPTTIFDIARTSMSAQLVRKGAGSIQRNQHTRREIEKKLKASAELRRLARQVRLVDTSEGIRIDLVDDADFSMFHLGTTVVTQDARQLLQAIGGAVSTDKGELTIRGHTDALPWKQGGGGNNWSLSAGRAEATRQALMREGIGEPRFKRIEGVADRKLLIPANPRDPRNRRISILLLN